MHQYHAQVHWQMEGEDFEGYVKHFRRGTKYSYEVAYDDGDEEWGWFSASHFHTDEVSRKYSWLTDQVEVVARALLQVQTQPQGAVLAETAQPQAAGKPAGIVSSSLHPTAAAGAVAASIAGSVGSIAGKKDQLRATQISLSDRAAGHAAAAAAASNGQQHGAANSTSEAVSSSNPEQGTPAQPAQSVAPQPHVSHILKAGSSNQAAPIQDSITPVQHSSEDIADLSSADTQPRVSASAAAKLQLTAKGPSLGHTSPIRKRKSNQLQSESSAPADASTAVAKTRLPSDAAQSAGSQSVLASIPDHVAADPVTRQGRESSPEKTAKQKAASEKRVKHAHDPQLKADAKEHKRKRLRKASELETPDGQLMVDHAQVGC